jgi:WD40 repeat protein
LSRARKGCVVAAILVALALVAATGTAVVHLTTPLVFAGHSGTISALAFSPRGDLLASASYDKTVRLWSVPDGDCIATFPHADKVRTVAFSFDRIATGAEDNTLAFWSTRGDLLSRQSLRFVTAVAFSSDGRLFATDVHDVNTAAGVKIVNARDLSEVATFSSMFRRSAATVAFSPAGDRVAFSGWPNGVEVWEIATRRQLLLTQEGFAVAFSPDGAHLAVGLDGGETQIYALESGARVLTLPGEHADSPVGGNVCYSPDGELILVAAGPRLRAFSARNGASAGTVKMPANVYDCAFSPDGRYFATGGATGQVWIYETRALRLLALRGG